MFENGYYIRFQQNEPELLKVFEDLLFQKIWHFGDEEIMVAEINMMWGNLL